MKCSRCGEELIPGDKFCTNCGYSINEAVQANPIQTNTIQSTTIQPQNAYAYDTKKANQLCIISLLLYFVAPLVIGIVGVLLDFLFKSEALGTGFSGLGVVTRIAAFVIVIVARAKYPTSKFAKVLLWVYIGLLIASFVLIIVLIILVSILVMNL